MILTEKSAGPRLSSVWARFQQIRPVSCKLLFRSTKTRAGEGGEEAESLEPLLTLTVVSQVLFSL